MADPSTDKLEALITNGRELARRAQDALDATQRMFAEAGIDPAGVEQELRRLGGDEAVAQVRRRYEAMVREIEDEVARERTQSAREARPRRARTGRPTV